MHDELVEVEHALSVVGGGRSADGKLTATLILESLHGLKSLVVGTDRGYLRMHELPLENEVPIDYFNAHYGEVGTLKHSPDRRMVNARKTGPIRRSAGSVSRRFCVGVWATDRMVNAPFGKGNGSISQGVAG